MAQDGWKREQGSAGCQQSDRGILCANNCGFFGSATTLNMCSKCYTAHITKTMQAAATATASAPSASPSASPSPSPSTSTPQVSAITMTPVPVTSFRSSAPEATSSAMGTPPVRTSECLGESSSSPSLVTPSSTISTTFASLAVPGAARSGCSGAGSASAAAAGGSVASSAVSSHCSPPRPVNRCGKCNRRVGLTGFKCRCDGVFCSAHRYSDRHECTFDYKTAGRALIAKANPVVKADKVDRI